MSRKLIYFNVLKVQLLFRAVRYYDILFKIIFTFEYFLKNALKVAGLSIGILEISKYPILLLIFKALIILRISGKIGLFNDTCLYHHPK